MKILSILLILILLINFNIIIKASDESNVSVKFLSQGNHYDRYPVYSSDGSKIVFQSQRDGNVEIYIMDSDGKNQKRVTFTDNLEMHPIFSPDGKRIAYTSFPPSGDKDSNVYIRDVDTGNDILITQGEDIYGAIPYFSPDGAKLVFARWAKNLKKVKSEAELIPAIYVIDLNSEELTRITHNPGEEWRPVFSPDGKKIAFISHRDGNYEIYIIDADGKNQKRLTSNDADEWDPTFSPAGKQIVFSSRRDGNWNIYIMDVNGANQTKLTDDPKDEWDPSFSPDGKKIIFAGERGDQQGIFIMENPLSK